MLFSSTFGYVISSIIELEKFQRQFYVMEVCILIIQFDIWFCNFLNFWASCSNDRPSVTGRTFKNWKDPWLKDIQFNIRSCNFLNIWARKISKTVLEISLQLSSFWMEIANGFCCFQGFHFVIVTFLIFEVEKFWRQFWKSHKKPRPNFNTIQFTAKIYFYRPYKWYSNNFRRFRRPLPLTGPNL